MNRHYNILIFNLVISLTILAPLQAQPIQLQEKYELAEAYLLRFENDSAYQVLSEIHTQLKKEQKLNTNFGIQILSKQAEALEKAEKNLEAITLLLTTIDICQQHKNWKQMANSYLSMARLHEKLGRWKHCFADLKNSELLIKREKLDSIYPIWATRISSYYRLNNQKDSAIHYAYKAIAASNKLGNDAEAAVGHLLLGIMFADTLYKGSIAHFDSAGQTWLRLGDYNGYSAVLNNISRVHFRYKNYPAALLFNDSSLQAIQQNKDHLTYFLALQQRGRIFGKMGLADSAIHYLELGYQKLVAQDQETEQSKVAEIEAKYNDEKKARLIAEQSQQIQADRNRQYWLWAISSIFATLILILSFYSRRLNKAKKLSHRQSAALAASNLRLETALEQQKLLLGEVHHRVKNNLQIIISLLELQAEELDDLFLQKKLKDMSNRIFSMAAIHELMYQQENIELVSLEQYIPTLCAHISDSSRYQVAPEIKLTLEPYTFNMSTLIPLGIMINELLTNSIKHGQQPDLALRISIELKKERDYYHLHYRDNGPGFPNGKIANKSGSLGAYLLTSMARQLGGSINSHNENGAVVDIHFKVKN